MPANSPEEQSADPLMQAARDYNLLRARDPRHAAELINWTRGIRQVLYLGSAGALDAVVLSGITAVMLCELFGEIIERITTGKADSPHEDGAIQGGQRA